LKANAGARDGLITKFSQMAGQLDPGEVAAALLRD